MFPRFSIDGISQGRFGTPEFTGDVGDRLTRNNPVVRIYDFLFGQFCRMIRGPFGKSQFDGAGDVFPIPPTDHRIKTVPFYSKFIGKIPYLFTVSISASKFNNLFLRKIGHWMTLASNVVFSIFAKHVLGVVPMGTKEKMIGICARRIVAFMQYEQTFGDGSTIQNPRYPVSELIPFTVIDLAISYARGTGPTPTTIGLLDLVPKPFFECFAFHKQEHSTIGNKLQRGVK